MDRVDIAKVSMALSDIKTLSTVGTAMLSKSLDDQEALGEGMAKMLELSVNPAVGANFDTYA